MRKLFLLFATLSLLFVISACGEDTSTEEKQNGSKAENIEKKKEKTKQLTIEEKSKQFIDANLESKTLKDFNEALIKLDDEKLEDMIINVHRDGQQFSDDFDLLGRKAKASGIVTRFIEQSRNTYNDLGRKSGSVTFTRDDKFIIYMGNKNINDFDKIEYDSLIHKEQDKNNFFFGAYPEEIINFVTVDLDEEATLTIGDTVAIEGRISNYVLRRSYDDKNKIDEFYTVIDEAHIIK